MDQRTLTEAELDALVAEVAIPVNAAGLADPIPAPAPAPAVLTDVPVIAGRQQAQGDVGFAPADCARPHWAQQVRDRTITLVTTNSAGTHPGNGHVLRAVTAGHGRVYWAEGGDPTDEHVIGFLEVIGGPHEAVALIEQPGGVGHKPLALGQGRYWVCRQMCTGPDGIRYRVID